MTLTRERLVALHGRDSIAVSTLQPGLEAFASASGFLAYRRARGYDVVLGPPLCAPQHREELLAGFLARSRRPFFAYLDGETAVLLRSQVPEVRRLQVEPRPGGLAQRALDFPGERRRPVQ